MGCWNHTCALTKLPVMYNEPVYVFWLLKQDRQYKQSYCYANEFWDPLIFHFEGEYDDYGGVKNCHGPMLEPFLKFVKSYLYEMEEGENKYHDVPIKKESLTIDTLFKYNHEGRLFLRQDKCLKYLNNRSELRHVVIRKQVLDKLLDEYTITTYSNPENEYITTNYNELVESGRLYLDDLANQFNTNSELAKYTTCSSFGFGQNLFNDWIEGTNISHIRRYLNLWLNADIEAHNYEDAKYLIQQVCTLLWLSSFMSDTRQMWHPQVGVGSQEYNTNSYELLNDIIQSEIKTIKELYDEEYDD
ncbi:MAG: hypothetical protein ACXW2E_01190 [Nitrososphaeraceae archaeon]